MENIINNILTIFGFFLTSLFVLAVIGVIYLQILTKNQTINDFYLLEKRNVAIVWVLAIISTILISIQYFSGESSQIGSWLEEDWYTQYYVYLYYDKNDVKNYKLPALAYRNDGDYFIEEIYWPNGNILYLNEEVIPGVMCEVEDLDYNDYYVILSDEKVN